MERNENGHALTGYCGQHRMSFLIDETCHQCLEQRSEVARVIPTGVVQACRDRVAKLPVTSLTEELRRDALLALDALCDAYAEEQSAEARDGRTDLELVAELKGSLQAKGLVA